MDNFYLVYLHGGQLIIANSLEDIKRLAPDATAIECIMFAAKKKPNSWWYRLGFVDTEGKPVTFGYYLNGWKVSAIDREVDIDGYTNEFKGRITLTNGGIYRNYILKDGSPYFIFNELKPMIERLDKCDTDDEIADILGKPQPTIDELQRENDELKVLINRIKELLKDSYE